jgi:hypothetical protein
VNGRFKAAGRLKSLLHIESPDSFSRSLIKVVDRNSHALDSEATPANCSDFGSRLAL